MAGRTRVERPVSSPAVAARPAPVQAGTGALAALQQAANAGAAQQRLKRLQDGVNGGAAALQRYRVGPDDKTLREVKNVEAAEAFLTANGLHYFYGYKSVWDNVTDRDYIGVDGARALAGEMQALLNQQLAQEAQAQDSVQRKLIEIAELVRRNRQGVQVLSQDADTLDWYDGIVLNGLCLGFTEVFKTQGKWEQELWKAIVSWVPEAGSPAESLEQLNRHLDGISRRIGARMEENALEGALMLKEAWEGMGSNYDPVPPSVGGITGAPAAIDLEQQGQMTRVVKSELEAGEFVTHSMGLIVAQSKQDNANYVIEISTPNHSMMVRLEGARIRYSETEKSGIGEVDSLPALMAKLWPGIQIGYEQAVAAGIPLDIDVKREVALGTATDLVPENASGIFAEIEEASLKTFAGFDKASGPGEFLADYNRRLFEAIYVTK